jgi:hypothetical protein
VAVLRHRPEGRSCSVSGPIAVGRSSPLDPNGLSRLHLGPRSPPEQIIKRLPLARDSSSAHKRSALAFAKPRSLPARRHGGTRIQTFQVIAEVKDIFNALSVVKPPENSGRAEARAAGVDYDCISAGEPSNARSP